MRSQRNPRPISQRVRKIDRAIRDAILELKGNTPPPGPASVATLWYNAIEGRPLSYNGLLVILTSAIEDGKSEEAVQGVAAAFSRSIAAEYRTTQNACPMIALVTEAELDAAADRAQALALAERTPSALRLAAEATERQGRYALVAARVLYQAAEAQAPAVRSA